jgi:tRNA threonylcarbamoyl adenosine modification protein YeaZ
MPDNTSLVLNCATSRAEIAIYQNDAMALSKGWGNPRSTGNLLQSSLESMLQHLELELIDLNSVIFAHGPGSFTGLRVGLSFLKGLFFDLSPDYAGVSTLDALARSVNAVNAEVYPCIFYRRDAVFSAGYRKQDSIVQRFRDPFVMTAEELAILPDGIWLTGNFEPLLPPVSTRLDSSRFNLMSPPDRELSLDWLYRLGREELASHGGRQLAIAEPLYQVEFTPTPAGKGKSS